MNFFLINLGILLIIHGLFFFIYIPEHVEFPVHKSPLQRSFNSSALLFFRTPIVISLVLKRLDQDGLKLFLVQLAHCQPPVKTVNHKRCI